MHYFLTILPQGSDLRHAQYRLRHSCHRLPCRVDVVHAFQVRGAFETDDELPELAAECDLGERAEAVADRDQAERCARDQRIARLADAGGDGNSDERIGIRRVGFRQQAEREPPHALGDGVGQRRTT